MEHHALKSNIQQSILSRRFLFGVLAFVFVVFFSQIEVVINVFRSSGLQQSDFYNQFILGALKSDAMILSLPIICALPFTVSFVEDIKSGFIKSYLHRITVREYIVSKVVTCAISGGLVLVLGAILSYASVVFIFSPMCAPPVEGAQTAPFVQPFVIKLILFFVSGSLWSLVGMTAASATNSKHMAYAFPFIVYYLLIILKERYFPNMYVIYPKEWLLAAQGWILGDFGMILIILEFISIVSVLFVIVAKRRLKSI